ncbi:Pantothenate transporter liz1 [Colletotrichum tropicale]|nr:Pantothenate transporter liz1 [Colletotrichum tropicale]
MNLKNLWHALPLTSGFFASTCPSEIHATIPETDGYWVSDRRSRSIHQIHSLLETCPKITTLDLRFALIGCVGFPERWSFPFNPAGGTKYASAIRDLTLNGYNFGDSDLNYISLYGWDHTLQWIMSGNAYKFLKWRLLPRDQRAKTNLELWIEAMDFSQLRSLSIRCDSCRNSSTDSIAKLLAPKLPSLRSLSVEGPDMLDFILALPAGSLKQLTWIEPQYSEETFRLVLEHHGSSLTVLEWRSAETLCRPRPLLPMPILRDMGHLAPRLKALTIDLNRHNTSWPLDDMATLLKSIPDTLSNLTIYFEMASECRRQKNDFDWGGRGETIEEIANLLLNSTTARELACFLQDNGGQSLEQVEFFAGDWERDWGKGVAQAQYKTRMADITVSEASPLLPAASSSSSSPPPRRPDMASRIKTALWGPPSVERSLLIKLDFTVLIYFSVVWFLFGINRASYSTAYISGMKEDLNFQGKDFNYMHTIYLVTYAVFQIPSTSILTIVKPRYVFVAANTVWSVLTLVTFRATHVYQVFILNGFEGAFSAIAYVGAHFIYGSWYKQSELATRAAVFCAFGNLGNMAGGWIQAGLLASLSNGPIAPWRLIFVVVSCVTIPFAVFGWFAIPDLPEHRSARFLSLEERDLAVTRLGRTKIKEWDLSIFRRVLLSWQFWLLPTVFMLYSLSVQAIQNNVMPLWMASRGYSVIQQNNYPTAIYATGIIATFIYCAVSDKLRSRWQASLCIGFTFIVSSAILISDPPDAGYFFAFYLMGTTYAPQALWYSWMADLTAHDLQLRAITTGFMNSFDFAFVTWWPLIFYPVTDAPNYQKGYIASLVTGALTVPVILLIAFLERRGRRNGTIAGNINEGSYSDEHTDTVEHTNANERTNTDEDANTAKGAEIATDVSRR